MRCPVCECENRDDAGSCVRCGVSLRSTTASDERRLVTVLFADIVSSSQLTIQDAERLREQMMRFFSLAREEIARHGGTVQKFIGDAVMAVFGLPVVHEDDPLRATRTAVAIRDRMRPGIDQGWLPAIRIGIGTGQVVVDTRAATTGAFVVTGEAANLAARLQQGGSPGQILVDASTQAATESAFRYQRLPPATLKGWQQPVEVYECQGASSGVLVGRDANRIRSPLVGRTREVAILNQSVDRLFGGQGGLVWVIGEAGVGKSRLIADIRRRFATQDLRWLEGSTLSLGRVVSYWPFISIIRGAAGIAEDESESLSWTKLEGHLEGLFNGEASEIIPYLATVLAIPVRDDYAPQVRYLDGEAMGRHIFRTMRRYFERLARNKPLVVVVEDLHWIDDSSRELLEHILPLVQTVPLLVIGASRPDSRTATMVRNVTEREYAAASTEFAVAPLASDEAAELLRNLVGSDLPTHLQHLILNKAEGNPFFLEEVVRSLIGQRVIVRDAPTSGWRVVGRPDDIAIPNTLRGVILARIDGLDAEPRQALRTASVVGRSFPYRVLRAVAEADETLEPALRELERLEFIREKTPPPDLEYVFNHALVQEAAYETLLVKTRRELHRRVAEALEALFGSRREEVYSVLAYHYARAEIWNRAWDYLLLAGDHAGAMSADSEALAHYRQAVSAYERAFGDRWDPVQRAALNRKIGEALFRQGAIRQAREDLGQALSLTRTPMPGTRWGMRGKIVREVCKQLIYRVTQRPLGRPENQRAEAEHEQARVHALLGWMARFDDPEALLFHKLSLLNIAEPRNFGSHAVNGFMGVAVACDHIWGLFPLASYYHGKAVQLAGSLGEPAAEGLAYLGLAIHEAHQGNWQSANAHYHRSSEACWAGGDLLFWACSEALHGWLHFCRGDLEEGAERLQAIVRVGHEVGDKQILAWGLFGEGIHLFLRGSVDESAGPLERARELAKSVPDHFTTIGCTTFLAHRSLRQGEFSEALTALEWSLSETDRTQMRGMIVSRIPNVLAEAHLWAAERGGDVAEVSLGKAAQACHRALKEARMFSEAAPAAYRNQGTYEWLRARHDRAQRWWTRSLASAEHLGSSYEVGLTLAAIGRYTGESQALRRAKDIFERIGARTPT